MELQRIDDDFERCALCGAPAVGPCASCKAMLCGDCCVLTDGGTSTYAICLRCDRRKGRSLTPAWRSLLIAAGLLLVGLALFAALSLGLLR